MTAGAVAACIPHEAWRKSRSAGWIVRYPNRPCRRWSKTGELVRCIQSGGGEKRKPGWRLEVEGRKTETVGEMRRRLLVWTGGLIIEGFVTGFYVRMLFELWPSGKIRLAKT